MQATLEASSYLWRPFREADDARVFYIDLAVDASRETEALDWLDDAERSRRRRFLYPRPRREYTLCRAALRSLLCRELGCRNGDLSFETAKFGKPSGRVGGVPVPVAFNVSHSGRHGLIALAPEGRIGVDVEERSTHRNLDGYIRLLFAPEERAELEKASGNGKVELFYRLWTLKEALVKAVGAGLSLDTTRFEIPAAMVRGRKTGTLRFPETAPVAWRLENIGNADFAAAIAYEPAENRAENPSGRGSAGP